MYLIAIRTASKASGNSPQGVLAAITGIGASLFLPYSAEAGPPVRLRG